MYKGSRPPRSDLPLFSRSLGYQRLFINMGRNFANSKQSTRAGARRHRKQPAGSSDDASSHLDNPWVSKLQLLRPQRRSRKKIVVFSGAGISVASGSESVHGPFFTQGLIV